jgi:5-methylcytosine-specific restriction endonuclease McrA
MRQGPLRMLRSRAVAQQTPHQWALEVDHIVPRNQDGSDDISNLQASYALRRKDQKGKVAATSERRISRVSGSMGEGSKPMWR